MSAARWDRIKDVFDAALHHEPASRAEYLSHACAEDDDLLTEVQSLLAAYEAAGTFINHPVAGARPPADEHLDAMTNRRIGPYRILRRAGQGGMAEVYLGVRADRLYQRFVAIKLVSTGLDSEEVLRRFRHERQTLAVLDHPNIVKLLDAGTTDQGLPYLVMDFVQGQPVDEYCDSRKLSTAERLQVFRTICAAVHYAHQNLVVHRDLKPSNVLVTAEGVPKLLDFGIAKLLRPEYSADTIDLTRSELRPMTLEFASPEQIRDEPITTASDIYSLGVLLYLLLTGHRPYRVHTHSALEYERAICETEPERPSGVVAQPAAIAGKNGARPVTRAPALVSGTREETPEKLRRKLQGDVDNIVLMAMRKEPQRRYASAEQFSEDIRRHLAGLPVIASKDTVRYRTAKFVRRHKAGAVTAALVTVGLVGGIVAIIRQERVAQTERARAERRFNDVRQLARFVLFKLDDELQKGLTPARRVLIGEALPYLDRLSTEAPDVSLAIDLIEGYLKIGDVQGNLYGPNLGDAKAAEVSYRKALQLAENWSRPGSHPTRELARANQKLGELLSVSGDVGAALQLLGKALQMFETRRAAAPDDRQAKDDLVMACDALGAFEIVLEHLDEAEHTYQRYFEVSRERYPVGSEDRRRFEAQADVQLGKILGKRGQPEEGIQRIRSALRVYGGLSARDRTERRSLAVTHTNLADLQRSAGRPVEALESLGTALTTFDVLSREDPTDEQFQRDRAVTLAYLAHVLLTLKRTEEARRRTADSLDLFRRLADQPDASAQSSREYAWGIVETPFSELQDRAAALKHARRAKEMTYPSDPATLYTLASAYDLNGDTASAVKESERALDLLLDRNSEAHLPRELREQLVKLKEKSAKQSAAR